MKKFNFFKYVLPLTFAGIILSAAAGCGDNNNPLGGDNTIDTTQTGGQGGNQQGGTQFANYKTLISGMSIFASNGKDRINIGKADMKTHDGGFAHPGDTIVYASEGKVAYIVNPANGSMYPKCTASGTFSASTVPNTAAVEKAKAEGYTTVEIVDVNKESGRLCKEL
jgi:hypothetical protein